MTVTNNLFISEIPPQDLRTSDPESQKYAFSTELKFNSNFVCVNNFLRPS